MNAQVQVERAAYLPDGCFYLFCSLCDFQEFLVSISEPTDLTLESLSFKQLCVSPFSSSHAHLLKREVELLGNPLNMLSVFQ